MSSVLQWLLGENVNNTNVHFVFPRWSGIQGLPSIFAHQLCKGRNLGLVLRLSARAGVLDVTKSTSYCEENSALASLKSGPVVRTGLRERCLLFKHRCRFLRTKSH